MSNTATPADAPPPSSAATSGGNHGGGGPGKIARLPAEVRHLLNERLLDAQPPQSILDWLNALPAVQAVIARHFENQPVTLKNLSSWENGPAYQEWSARRDLLDDARDWSEAAADTRAENPQLAQHVTLLLAAQLGRQINHLRDHPDPVYRAKALLRIARALAALRRQQLKRDQLDLAARRAAPKGPDADLPPALEKRFWEWMKVKDNENKCYGKKRTPTERWNDIIACFGMPPLPPEDKHMDAPDYVPLAADGKPFPNHFCLWPPKRALNDPSDWGDGLTPAEYNHLMDEQWSRIVEEALAAGKPFPVAATTASEHNGGWPVGIYPGDPIPEGVQIPVRLKHPLRQGTPGDKPDPVACPLPTTSADDPRPPIRPPPDPSEIEEWSDPFSSPPNPDPDPAADEA